MTTIRPTMFSLAVFIAAAWISFSSAQGWGEEARDVPSAAPVTSSDDFTGRWEQLPLPAAERPDIHCAGTEPGGMLWIMVGRGLYYWNGREFSPPVSGPMKSGGGLEWLFGGADRGLYATQPSQKEHQGKLYRLCDGAANAQILVSYKLTPTE